MLPIPVGAWSVSLRLSNPVTCLDWWYSVITFLAVSYVSSDLTLIFKCCRSVPVVLLNSVATSMLSGSAVPACVSYFVFSVSHSLRSCSNCSVPNLNSSKLFSKLISGAVPGSENSSVSKRHVSNPFSSTFLRTTSWALPLVIRVSSRCKCLLNSTNSVSPSSLYHLLSNTSVHHLWLMHLLLQHSPVLSVLLPQTVRRMISLANSTLAIAPACHWTRQAVAVLHFFQGQCLQGWPLLSSVVAGVSAPLPWKDLGSFSSTTNSEQF